MPLTTDSFLAETDVRPRTYLPTSVDWSKAEVAELSNDDIRLADERELIDIVSQALPLPTSEQLQMAERDVLERLAHLARRTCRNQGY